LKQSHNQYRQVLEGRYPRYIDQLELWSQCKFEDAHKPRSATPVVFNLRWEGPIIVIEELC